MRPFKLCPASYPHSLPHSLKLIVRAQCTRPAHDPRQTNWNYHHHHRQPEQQQPHQHQPSPIVACLPSRRPPHVHISATSFAAPPKAVAVAAEKSARSGANCTNDQSEGRMAVYSVPVFLGKERKGFAVAETAAQQNKRATVCGCAPLFV